MRKRKPKKKRAWNLKGRISSALRRVWMRCPERTEALKNACVRKGVWRCASCGKEHPRKGVHVDHIDPVGKFVSWNVFVERLFCGVENLQILCLACHHRKTHPKRDT